MYFTPECFAPGKDFQNVLKKRETLKRDDFEKLKDDYYGVRGWDIRTGLQTKAKLKALDIEDIAVESEKRNLHKQ